MQYYILFISVKNFERCWSLFDESFFLHNPKEAE